ncbi:pyruvate:ferredoxin (flavodoxin) oxidoreductase [Commensalibacter papalotli (ex Botero et al. 2024)]|nr:pyruvate:ferredoxin (flavodoxin) oxidoreductase [Commensalibacter papalotli (ex Botero et al. 2024)]CAI3934330.1 Fe-S protein subunit (SdhB/FrdB) (PDB:6LUM) [Commensalibacter papalotli (ex Botero et al. 2024)]
MSNKLNKMITVDANQAAASIAYTLNEVIAIYPITPSSTMAEYANNCAVQQLPNLWGDIPRMMEMQSEGGAISTVHGALQTGALATTFTSSQGLLLMIPSLYKIAGQLMPFVLHVAARTIATSALSIFGDHSDVMAVRQTGCALLCASNVQEAQDFATIAQIASLKSRVPFIHFFDGFRTSHEMNKIYSLEIEELKQLVPEDAIREHRNRALSPENPIVRGTAANPDTYFQAREATNLWYDAVYAHVEQTMQHFDMVTGRYYHPFEYYGHPNATKLIVLMGSGVGPCEEVIDMLCDQGDKVGLLKVRLYRPFSAMHFLEQIPETIEKIAVLDRTKEAGSQAEPLYLDVMTAFSEAYSHGERSSLPKIINGRYGLSSKEFDPDCVMAIFNELQQSTPKRRFTVGINDDVTHLSIKSIPANLSAQHSLTALFYGLGSDGSVSATKNTIKIIGDHTDNYTQGFFVYDSKKAGGLTTSHLRISKKPIKSTYLIQGADFVGCHQWQFIDKYPVLDKLKAGGVFLLNTPYEPEDIWENLPYEVQSALLEKEARFYVINAYKIARECKLGTRINTIMQTAFFHLTSILPEEDFENYLKQAIIKSYQKKGDAIVQNNLKAIIQAKNATHQILLQPISLDSKALSPIVPVNAPEFVKEITGKMLIGYGDSLPVSALPPDGTWPTGTTQWEKRRIAEMIPIWNKASMCVQCNICVAACPHAAIRAKVANSSEFVNAPETLQRLPVKAKDFKGQEYVLQVSPEDCTGCNICYEVCPAKDKEDPSIRSINMLPIQDHLEIEKNNFEFFQTISDRPISSIERIDLRTSQLVTPLFEYSGACSGCGETPYIKLLTQLFGEKLFIANATGCSSIYGGNLPTTPYTTNCEGRGPTWANSLFEDNAEFGLGFRLTIDQHKQRVLRLLDSFQTILPATLIDTLKNERNSDLERRNAMREMQDLLKDNKDLKAQDLIHDAHYLLQKSIWLVGGDGWAYDIGFGGLDHVLSTGENVNVLVLDTQCYSNTGGQQSKATPMGAITKFGELGKEKSRKDLGLSMMMYGNIFVAQISLGAQMNQTIKALQEAEAYPGPSLIIAYSPCGEHGYNLAYSHEHMKELTNSGFWPLYRFDPSKKDSGKSLLTLDSKLSKEPIVNILHKEQRFNRLWNTDPERADALIAQLDKVVSRRYSLLTKLSEMNFE